FRPGDTVEKQLILINNSRETVSCECEWSLTLPRAITATKKVSVKTGEQERIPVRFDLPATLAAGSYEIGATVRFSNGQTQTDAFHIHVLPRPPEPPAGLKLALFDPKGETGKLLASLNVRFQSVEATADLSPYEVLLIGKEALTSGGPGPDVTRVRTGLKVIVFEQTAKVLEQRFGFRVAGHGRRQGFPHAP